MYEQEQIKPYGKEGTKREQVEQMFNNIAHSYDVLNHTLSLGVDKVWRNAAINYLKPFFLPSPIGSEAGKRVILDIATGTGDFAILAHKKLGFPQVVGCDISEGMMNIGRQKVEKLGLSDKITFKNEDCSCLSFSDNSFGAVISAFALRNFQNLDQCLKEMHRVLNDGGHLSVIDLCTPVSFPMKQLFYIYKKAVMPLMGKLISKDNLAYTYLPDTMEAIPQGERMQRIIQQAGFRNVNFRRLPFGMCILYTAKK
ncbi:MAG: bifunctional demethylmenaquinone methyltransferase/2-methoxy-6-polyprenyl-1,4-benzoquinol methylase UbiE [Prevotellaceae bacterium]|nr:bifunctional demethylmenaquinone methyltransferase/2-methoxy-6-polyprenyl-1,4-benzoquinol methylase UbiE [Prevotellaceae bacterium]